MLKSLFKDSIIYGIANVLQKLVPLLVIPIITHYLGSNALKIYDVSFVYAYLFSWLIILGQDNAASILYFSSKDSFDKPQVLKHGLAIQLGFLCLAAIIFLPLKNFIADALFRADEEIEPYWLKALLIIPGHIVLNYSLNMMIWKKMKNSYLFLCLLQVLLTLGGVSVAVVMMNGDINRLFLVLIASTTISATAGLLMLSKTFLSLRFTLNKVLLKKLVWIGVPFALTSFFHQILPSIDRYFLLQYHYAAELPQYILAVKLGGMVSVGVSAFVLAFTPYSMNKINEVGGEKEISALFQFVSVTAMITVPALLLFKDLLVDLFADPSYQASARLLPLFFFAWVFDLFYYFSVLSIYKSQKSYFVLLLFILGVVLICGFNALLIPVYGIYGAAISFCIVKVILFFVPLVWLRKYFRISIQAYSFLGFLALAIFCSYLVYTLEMYQYLVVLAMVLITFLFYLNKLFHKHRNVLAL